MIYAVSFLTAVNAFTAPNAAHSLAAVARPQLAPALTPLAVEMSASRRAHLGALAGATLAGFSSAVSAAEPRSTPWSFSTFLDAIEQDLVEKVSFSSDGKQVLIIDRDGNRHEALILKEDTADLIRLLTKKGVTFAVQEKQQPGQAGAVAGVLANLAFPLLIIGGLIFLQNRNNGGAGGGPMGGMGGPMGIGKSRSKIQMEPETGVTFADVAGQEASKQELAEIVEFLKNPSKYSALGAKIPRGAVMEGPPGTGKTLLARAVAGEAGVPFISASGSEFVEMFVGVGASRVRDLFGEAKKNAPCIVFIDEIDAVGRQRAGGGRGGMGGGNDEREQTLNQILTEMDGFEGNSGVIVLAATNRADVLDSALTRPGRFDRRVPVDLPDVKGRKSILEVHARGKPLSDDMDLDIVAKRTTGFSGAALANLMNEAAIVAARNDKSEITYDEIDFAIDRQTVGMVKTTGTSFPNRQRLVAYHEAGHAVMGLLTPNYDMVTKVTILPRTNGAGGFTLFTPPEERLESGLYSKSYLKGQLAVALGGRVAEEIVYGAEEITTGASGDLQQVRNIARRMVTQWGYSKDKLAPVAWEMAEQQAGGPTAASPAQEKIIDEEVKLLVAEAYAHCKAVLTANRELVDEMTEMMIEKETLDYKELQDLVKKYYPDGLGNEKIPLPASAALM